MITSRLCVFLFAALITVSCGSETTTEQEQDTASETIATDETIETRNEDPDGDPTGNASDPGTEASTNIEISTPPAGDENGERRPAPKELSKINVSFISIGEGIDFEAAKNYENYVEGWKSASGKKLTYETISWGREGETDFCFDMTNISDNESKKFLNETRERFKNNDLVQITTNQPCREPRIRN